MRRFFFIFALMLCIDQMIKFFFNMKCEGIEGCRVWEGEMLSLMLVFNQGVAFSFLSFLGEWLKYLQIVAIVLIILLLYRQKDYFFHHLFAFALIFAGGVSNILDRFVYGGVVDYIYWHYLFEFAVFNFADVMIDCGALLLLYGVLRKPKAKLIS